jgi:hypothetical protein
MPKAKKLGGMTEDEIFAEARSLKILMIDCERECLRQMMYEKEKASKGTLTSERKCEIDQNLDEGDDFDIVSNYGMEIEDRRRALEKQQKPRKMSLWARMTAPIKRKMMVAKVSKEAKLARPYGDLSQVDKTEMGKGDLEKLRGEIASRQLYLSEALWDRGVDPALIDHTVHMHLTDFINGEERALKPTDDRSEVTKPRSNKPRRRKRKPGQNQNRRRRRRQIQSGQSASRALSALAVTTQAVSKLSMLPLGSSPTMQTDHKLGGRVPHQLFSSLCFGLNFDML